jgi:hypothetical protein
MTIEEKKQKRKIRRDKMLKKIVKSLQDKHHSKGGIKHKPRFKLKEGVKREDATFKDYDKIDDSTIQKIVRKVDKYKKDKRNPYK